MTHEELLNNAYAKMTEMTFGVPGTLDLGRTITKARFIKKSDTSNLSIFIVDNEVVYHDLHKFTPYFFTEITTPNDVSIVFADHKKLGDEITVIYGIIAQRILLTNWSCLHRYQKKVTIAGKDYTLSAEQLSLITDVANGKISAKDISKNESEKQ